MAVRGPIAINPRYILSVGDDPKQVLEPIWGYAREPLVSLEEACAPLHSIVSRLEPHIWVALENSKNPSDDLSEDESAAIHLYTMEWEPLEDEPQGSLYSHLNRTLKMADRGKLRPWFRYLKLFLSALAKLPLCERQIIWRGVRRNHSADYPPGTQITWWPFSSCTTSLNVLESDLYLGNTGTRTLFSIEALNGRTVRNHSHFTTEDEILLLPGTYLEVLSQLNPAPDLHIIHLRQIYPPHLLLEPPFQGAELLPERSHSVAEVGVFKGPARRYRPWYQQKKVWIGAGIAAAIITIVAIILGVVLGTRKNNSSTSPTSPTSSTYPTTSPSPPFGFNSSANTTFSWYGLNWTPRNEVNTQAGLSNYSLSNVFVDSQGYLNMRLVRDTSGQWWCAQVNTQSTFSFGMLYFFVNGSVDKLDRNVVLRLFTKGSDDQTNGIVIEMGLRGQTTTAANNLWYILYPNAANTSSTGTSYRLPKLDGTWITPRINWTNSSITIAVEYDHKYPVTPNLRIFPPYTTDPSWASSVPQVPAPLYMSLCTYNGSAPTDGKDVYIVINAVVYEKF